MVFHVNSDVGGQAQRVGDRLHLIVLFRPGAGLHRYFPYTREPGERRQRLRKIAK
jgi:hypothetical protein